jgi:UDP-N-acetylglucosamine--dolichyl-phosphate N-acetylglucosaminephosphotransferase
MMIGIVNEKVALMAKDNTASSRTVNKDSLPRNIVWILLACLPVCLAWYHRDILGLSIGLSILSYVASDAMIKGVAPMLAEAGRAGTDLNKVGRPKIPESLGVVVGTVFLVTIFLFLPFPFMSWFLETGSKDSLEFPFQRLGEYTAALLSICSMLFLGFADDVLNLKWRHKVVLPAIATLPLLILYRVTFGVTNVVVPIQFRAQLGPIFDLGVFYYLYMAAVAIFCTHSINILAGVNGVEVGQSLVICASLIIHSVIGIFSGIVAVKDHCFFALYILLPFFAVSLALFKSNWYPAKVFVGDTYCYFAGMTFAVVGILGHFSKTLMLFFLPQIFNFLFSVPQLFGLIPCPRHRLPRLGPDGKLHPSEVSFDYHGLSALGQVSVELCIALGLVKEISKCEHDYKHGREMVVTNFTLLNFLLVKLGPLHEDHLAMALLLFQSLCCTSGFFIRYHISSYFFPPS